MTSLQQSVQNFNAKYHLKVDKATRTLDLSSEVGEICKLAFLESIRKPASPDDWTDELGDALYSLLSLMNEQEIDAQMALEKVLIKYEKRHQAKGSMGSGAT